MRPVYVFKMVSVDSGYVGTTEKIDCIGCFDCIVEKTSKSKSDGNKTEKATICKLTVPTGYHFKVGFMASLESDIKPDMKITAISEHTGHCICELESWK